MPSFRDRSLSAVDDAIIACIGAEATAAWVNGLASGGTVAAAVERFEKGLPLLLKLREVLRKSAEKLIGELE